MNHAMAVGAEKGDIILSSKAVLPGTLREGVKVMALDVPFGELSVDILKIERAAFTSRLAFSFYTSNQDSTSLKHSDLS